jgi:hypothetical protein
MRHILPCVTALLLAPPAGLHAADESAELATIRQRERAIMEAAARDVGELKGNSPMHAKNPYPGLHATGSAVN